MEQSPTHQYLSLPSDGQPWIRLLSLSPSSSRKAPLQCTLIHLVKGELPYEALSYAWGSQADPLPLEITSTATFTNGSFETTRSSRSGVHITRNLHGALLHLRKKKKARILWVDAVCISQIDLDEKQRQLGMMGSIYSEGMRTIVWIGEADKHTRRLFHCMRLVEFFHYTKMGGGSTRAITAWSLVNVRLVRMGKSTLVSRISFADVVGISSCTSHFSGRVL